MKKLWLVLPLICVASPSKAADASVVNTPTVEAAPTYEQIMLSARALLRSARSAQSLNSPDAARIHTTNAAFAFQRAAKVAPDDDKKRDALAQAGDHFSKSFLYESAAAVYEEALKIASLSTGQRAELLLLRAHAYNLVRPSDKRDAAERKRLRTWFLEAAEAPATDADDRRIAREQIASLWIEDRNLLNALLEYEATSQIADLDNFWASGVLQRAFQAATDWKDKKPAPEVVAVLERIAPRLLASQLASEKDAAKLVDLQINYADLLRKYGAPAKSYAVLDKMANDAKLSLWQRARAVTEIATQRVADKQPDLAIKAWDRAQTWPKPPAGKTGYEYQRAISVASVYEATGDETKVRATLATLLAMPELSDIEKTLPHYHIGLSHVRDIRKLQTSSTRSAAPTLAKIASHEAEAKKAFQTVADNQKALSDMRFNAATQHAYLESSNKRYPQARAVLQKLADDFKIADRLLIGVRDDHYVMPLMKNVAQIYFAEKLYGDAASSLASVAPFSGTDVEATEMLLELWQTALKEKSWDEARQTLEVMRTLKLDNNEYLLAKLELEIGAQGWPAAVTVMDIVNRSADAMSDGAEKTKLKKRIAELAAKIPAEVIEPARKKAREEFANGMVAA